MKKAIYTFFFGVMLFMSSQTFGQLSSIGFFNMETDYFYADSISNRVYMSSWKSNNFDGKPTHGLAYYDFTTGLADTMPSSMFDYPNACVTHSISRIDSVLYFFGGYKFKDSSGAIKLNPLIKWDGNNWLTDDTSCCKILGDDVYSNLNKNDTLYFGDWSGGFNAITPKNTVVGYSIANNNWFNLPVLGYNPSSGAPVFSICNYQNELYFGGVFKLPGSNGGGIAKLVNNTWQKVGNGFHQDSVYIADMVEYNGLLVCGGSFAGKALVKVWDGTSWINNMPLIDTSPTLNRIYDLELYNGILFAAGNFTLPDGSKNIARWDGTNWVGIGLTSFGGSLSGRVLGIKIYHNTMFIGGGFNSINGQTFIGLAKLDNVVGINEIPQTSIKLTAYPNPSAANINIMCPVSWENKQITVEVYNTAGQTVYSEKIKVTGNKCNINVLKYPTGIYFAILRNEDVIGKTIVVKQ